MTTVAAVLVVAYCCLATVRFPSIIRLGKSDPGVSVAESVGRWLSTTQPFELHVGSISILMRGQELPVRLNGSELQLENRTGKHKGI
ncbi:hypothetical protein B0H67DRAFT_559242 [Lasiosphaeris hirsuta]|uniref:Uncharacterized protein n=1 Tax=Lasiosphaeris hirsuta TaxID=260670 RepID=A0AA40E7B0_9PEZI|nr:hypothetical protein B0H67DRAFT_559242 [Lasiosphaeris hirsuta]